MMSTPSELTVIPQPPQIEVLSFAVRLPPAIVQGFDEPSVVVSPPDVDKGVVGTITVLNKSVMIWFGWGQLTTTAIPSPDVPNASVVGTALDLSMGPLMVAMPRTNYQGAFSAAKEVSSSKLIGSEAQDTEMVARQMASRLTQRLGVPVFVSCSFENAPSTLLEGVDEGMIQHRAAALAEKEVWRILQDKFPKK